MSRFWMPGAVRKPLTVNYTPKPRKTTNAIVYHVAVSEASTLHGWFSNPRARASSHFYIRRDGTIEQYIPINHTSWAGVNSDARAVSVETQGMEYGKWTAAQLESMIAIILFARSHYPAIPLRLATSSKRSEAGIGYHRLGVPATYVQKARGISQTNGELWSSAVGKTCPGPDRVKQMPALVARAAEAARGITAAKPKPVAPVKPLAGIVVGVPIRQVKLQLRDAGYYDGNIDDIAGEGTRAAIVAYQNAQVYFPGMLRDGQWGLMTQAHFEWTKRLQAALNKWKTAQRMGAVKVDGDLGAYTARLVKQTIADNFLGAYWKAVRAVFGRTARPVNDGQPGRAFAKMLGIPQHPSA